MAAKKGYNVYTNYVPLLLQIDELAIPFICFLNVVIVASIVLDINSNPFLVLEADAKHFGFYHEFSRIICGQLVFANVLW